VHVAGTRDTENRANGKIIKDIVKDVMVVEVVIYSLRKRF